MLYSTILIVPFSATPGLGGRHPSVATVQPPTLTARPEVVARLGTLMTRAPVV